MQKSSTTRIFLVRHGATQLSAEDPIRRRGRRGPSEEGRFQARKLAERLAAERIVAVYSSPLSRTVETAEILAGPHGLPIGSGRGCARSAMAAGKA